MIVGPSPVVDDEPNDVNRVADVRKERDGHRGFSYNDVEPDPIKKQKVLRTCTVPQSVGTGDRTCL